MSYNYYRKRNYNLSKSKARAYAQSMDDLGNEFASKYQDWGLSTMKDSCYKMITDTVEIRISNHSANNQYHNIYDDKVLLVNIKGSKLDFPTIIEKKVPKVEKVLDGLELTNYRFINVVGDKVNAYIKGYKTKKEIFELD
ncbi:hypothetical protein SY212_04160 [Ligilactobacillus agilis]|uniref:Uncharacterized protein n=1 Tax=Ligilactobacillus agilis TaxID=1601 RepID=A0A6F9XJG2_9LACO|nr:hypothetical protein [Ligilactobacillus agilis]GET05386.1 hypothetical protein SY212_04160 [Ligilactobacillus agilis]